MFIVSEREKTLDKRDSVITSQRKEISTDLLHVLRVLFGRVFLPEYQEDSDKQKNSVFLSVVLREHIDDGGELECYTQH